MREYTMLVLALWAWTSSPVPASAQQSFPLAPVRGLDELFPVPADNPLTPARVALGERLFHDKMLSVDRSVSCASCHQADHGFADTARLSRGRGGRLGRRNAPSIVNRAYGAAFFWDGRATSLESQVLMPIADPVEMGTPIDLLLRHLAVDTAYRRAFAGAFSEGLTRDNVARAIASYVRTIRSGDSPVDRYRSGDTTALTPDARRGLDLFFRRANCSRCHLGPNLTDERFHNTGVATGTRDAGRYAVTQRTADLGAFKTPTLRNVELTAPYMHDGSIATLDQVVEFYDRGGRPNPHLDREIQPLGLSADDKRELVAFLRALTGIITRGP